MTLVQTELKSMKIREQGQQSTTIYGPSGDTAGDTIIYSGTATDSGTYTFSAEVRAYVSGYYGCLDININGNTVETFRTDSMSYVSFSYETQIEVGDTIQLHLYGTSNQYGACNNVQITSTITTLTERDIKKVTIRPNGTEKQIRPVQWTPGANTIAYYPLKEDTNDYSGNNRNLTNTGVTFVNNIGGATIPVGYWDGSDKASRSWDVQLSGGYTISFWSKVNSSSNVGLMFDLRNESQQGQGVALGRCYQNNISFFQQKSSSAEEGYTESLTSNWTYWCVTRTGSVWSIYKNGNTTPVKQATLSNQINTSNSQLGVGCRHQTLTDNLDGYLSEMIIENTARTAQEVSDYYNQAKGNYGL